MRNIDEGNFAWPGFSENMRILKWIVDRVRGRTMAKESPIGWMPHYNDINWEGLDFPEERWDEIMGVERKAWLQELIMHEELFMSLRDHLPKELLFERELLKCRL